MGDAGIPSQILLGITPSKWFVGGKEEQVRLRCALMKALSALFRCIPPHCAQTNTARSASGAEVMANTKSGSCLRAETRAAPALTRKSASLLHAFSAQNHFSK